MINFFYYFIFFLVLIYFMSFIGAFLLNKDYLIILIFLEIMFLIINLLFVIIAIIYDDFVGFLYSLILLGLIAGESAIGLALIITFFRFNFRLLRSNEVRIKG